MLVLIKSLKCIIKTAKQKAKVYDPLKEVPPRNQNGFMKACLQYMI